MYQDPFASLKFVVLSTPEFAFKVDLSHVTRLDFESLLRLHDDKRDKKAILVACRVCSQLGHTWQQVPEEMELSAGVLNVPIKNFHERMIQRSLAAPRVDSPI